MIRIKQQGIFRLPLIIVSVGAVFLCGFKYIKGSPYIFPKINHFPPMPVTADNPVTIEGADLGRHLFYDPVLSFDSSFSCASCHKQENAFSDSPNRFSLGLNKDLQARNTMPLFNLAWYSALFWDGRASSIEAQVFHPVREKSEMNLNWTHAVKRIARSALYREKFKAAFGNLKIDSVLICKAIAQFERTLISHNSKYDRVIRREDKFTQDELEGMELINDMTKANCLHCHTSDADGLGTTGLFSNNGLDAVIKDGVFKDAGLGKTTRQPEDNGKFKIPSLRNLLYTAPYMHDGRFQKLEEVLDFYSEGLKVSPTLDSKMEFVHKGGLRLTAEEKRKIVLFLKTMSDPVFVSNKAFANPFVVSGN
jgi:cytochrome c peroxidase